MNIFNTYPEQEARNYTIKDKQLICQHCSDDTFFMQTNVVHWTGDLVSKRVTCFTCSECTHITGSEAASSMSGL
jgi:hypothetical protein